MKKTIKKLEELIRVYIRSRDGNRCVKCSKSISGSNSQVSHVIPRSHGNILKYDEQNLKLLCYHCHLNWWHKNPLEAQEWFKGIYPERYKYLMSKKEEICKLREQDLLLLIEEYKKKINTSSRSLP